MLNKLKAQLQGIYTVEYLKELERMEALLRLERFNSADALRLGNQIVLEAQKYGEDLIVRIVRLEALCAVRDCEVPVFHGKYV